MTDTFTIKDVEGSIPIFTGDDKMTIHRWLEEFEDTSILLRWSDLQKLIYGKRMLRGSAKQFIALQRGLTSWIALKRCLIKEFKIEINSATIHSQLQKRKRQMNETARQYVYAMQTIANQGYVEDDALIQYIIDGILDNEMSKQILYNSHSIDEVKKNLELYDRMCEKSGRKRSISKVELKSEANKDMKTGRERKDTGPSTVKKIRCFACGSPEHAVKECPHRDKGPKCFKCDQFGHISTKCCNSAKFNKGEDKINRVTIDEDAVVVQINEVDIFATLDTGSCKTLLRNDEYRKIGHPTLKSSERVFKGFGNARSKAIGVFNAELTIQGEVYCNPVYVVPVDAMDVKMLLGKDLQRQMDIRIFDGQTEIRKVHREDVVRPQHKPKKKSVHEDNTHKINNHEDNSDWIKDELPMINYVGPSMINVEGPYQDQIRDMIDNYTPNQQAQTEVEMKIVLKDQEPVYSKPRRLTIQEKQTLQDQVDEWLNKGIVKPSRSSYSSAVVIVKKKDGSHRVCIDYRRLNKKIIRDQFPMPLIEDCLDALAPARVFSVLDLQNAFFHVPVAAECQMYTSFVTHNGQYEFTKVPFGLCNSPTTFLRFVATVFQDLNRRGVVITYMDDLIVPSKNETEALERLRETLAVAADKGLSINWKKCKFLQREVEYLGHVVGNGFVRPSYEKISVVQKFPKPKNRKDIQSFLGLTGYFRKFILDYAIIARPLSDLLKGDQKFYFGAEQEAAFNELKTVLTKEPVLRIYKPDTITELHTDASKLGYGAILLQKDNKDDHFHPVHYMSCKTSDAEKNLHSYELEVLAIINALKKFRIYLQGIKFKIVTDCDAFCKTLDKRDLTAKIARWALFLEGFTFKVEHRAGSRLRHVDALSRYPILTINYNTVTQIIKKRQEEDERLRAIKQILQREPYEDYLIEQGVLMKKVAGKNVIALPSSMHMDIIRRTHENGHFGIKKMSESIKEEYYIPKLKEKLEKFIGCCVPCILTERKKGKIEGELMPIPKGDTPLSTYHVDHLGPMTSTSKLYKYLFLIVDGFSKFTWLYPTKTTSTKEVIAKLTTQKITFGNPQRIISDRGTAFTSAEFEEFCSSENIDHVKITTGVPRGNGQVERTNRIILPILTKLALDNPDRWYRYVDQVQSCLNSTYQRSIGMTPFELMFGVKMKRKEDQQILQLIEQESAELFDNDREELRNLAKSNLYKVQEENRRTFNRGRKKATRYKIDDFVVIKRTQFGSGLKIKRKFLGPYKISQVNGNNRYEVIRVGEGEGPKMTTTAADYMKPFLYNDSSGTEE